MKEKLFVIKKYIKARSAQEALRKDRDTKPDDVWIDDEWKKGNSEQLARAIGFTLERKE